jgi:hypothetical protein
MALREAVSSPESPPMRASRSGARDAERIGPPARGAPKRGSFRSAGRDGVTRVRRSGMRLAEVRKRSKGGFSLVTERLSGAVDRRTGA